MTKKELIEALADAEGITLKAAEVVVSTTFNTMEKTLSTLGRIEIRGFGTFKVKEYEGYNGHNPKTGEDIRVKPKKLPFFKVAKSLNRRINKDGRD